MPVSPTAEAARPPVGAASEIDDLRNVLGLTQAQLAQVLGISPRVVSRWKAESAQRLEPGPAHECRLRDLGQLRMLLETDAGADASREWMRRENIALRGRAPLDVLLEGDVDRVLGLVVTLGQGGFF